MQESYVSGAIHYKEPLKLPNKSYNPSKLINNETLI